MPDRIAVYPDRVEGSVDQPHGRPPTILTMHFRDVTSAFAGGNRGGKEKFWVPGGVVAEDHFDDPSNVGAMGMVQGPRSPRMREIVRPLRGERPSSSRSVRSLCEAPS
jgi:hypothetical protein